MLGAGGTPPAQALLGLVPAMPDSLVVTITFPSSGSTVYGTTTVRAGVSIAGILTVASVQFKLDGSNLGTEDTTAPYAVVWNTTAARNGSHALRALVRDTHGQRFTSEPVTVTVFNDAAPPTARFTAPAADTIASAMIAVSADASDIVGVAGTRFKLDGSDRGAGDTAARYAVVSGATQTNDDPYALFAVTRDAAGVFTTCDPVTVVAPNAAVPRYAVMDLGTLGGAASSAQGIDNVDGEVVGWSNTGDGARHAFLYRDGAMTDLGALVGGTGSQAAGVNGLGQVTGRSGVNEYGPSFGQGTQAFLWEGGAMRSLGALYCPCSFSRRYGTSVAHAINATGQVVGESETVRGEWVRHAFLWQDDTMQDIGGGAGDWSISRAFAINDRGQVVGDFAQDAGRLGSASAFDRRAFLWQSGVRWDLGALPGHTSSTALAINRAGQVVGWSGSSDGSVSRAFLWENGVMRDLGALPGDVNSRALGINAFGQVVGWSGAPDRPYSRAFLRQNGRMLDLNLALPGGSGWVLTEAAAIDDAGQIAGTGLHDGRVRAFLLQPVH